jgi:hypothetical protein
LNGKLHYHTSTKEVVMGKIAMTLCLPEPKARKKTAKAVQYHKDKTRYCRKAKHKGLWAESHGPFLFLKKLRA